MQLQRLAAGPAGRLYGCKEGKWQTTAQCWSQVYVWKSMASLPFVAHKSCIATYLEAFWTAFRYFANAQMGKMFL